VLSLRSYTHKQDLQIIGLNAVYAFAGSAPFRTGSAVLRVPPGNPAKIAEEYQHKLGPDELANGFFLITYVEKQKWVMEQYSPWAGNTTRPRNTPQ